MRKVFFLADLPPGELKDERLSLGGKGHSLVEMMRAGFPVPPAFTITTECCRLYLEDGGRWPAGLEDEVRENVSRLETVTGQAYGRDASPLLVSVRSGAPVSMPGMMDTVLNCGFTRALARQSGAWEDYRRFIGAYVKTVAGLPPLPERADLPIQERVEDLLRAFEMRAGQPFPQDPWQMLRDCISAVFRSWTGDRAAAYRLRHGIRGLHGTAVTIQAMFPSEVAGVLFTRDPGDPAADHLVIESSRGFGEGVVSGEVAPDRFIVRRSDNRVTVATSPTDRAPSLVPGKISELAALALSVEERFGQPMDIEWGLADGQFSLLQCRPIRDLRSGAAIEALRRAEIARLRAHAGRKRRVWVAHNLGETLRFPTPLTWDVVRRFMSGAGGFGRMYRDFGYKPSEEVCRDGFLELIGGRIYADSERASQLFWDGMPMVYDLDELLRDAGVLDRAPACFDPERIQPGFLLKLPALLVSMAVSSYRQGRARAGAGRRFERDLVPPYLDYIALKKREDVESLSTPELSRELQALCARVLDEFGKESLKPGFFGGAAFGRVSSLLEQIMGAEKGRELACTLVMGLDGDVTFEQDARLHRVARGEEELEPFLEDFGHRCVGEMELARPRWREDSTYVRRTIDRLRAGRSRPPEDVHQENVKRREAAERDLSLSLSRWGGASFVERILEDLREARELLPYRERAKHYLMMGYELIRRVLLELGRRWKLGEDVFFLRLEEVLVGGASASPPTADLGRRKSDWKAFQGLDLPPVIDSMGLERLGIQGAEPGADEMKGDAVAPGVATGLAEVVHDPGDASPAGDGYVLVCPSTDPGWTPLFLNARALIVERGGILSHGAIVARDFGIPAVVCKEATTFIRSGDRVRVDGSGGLVTVLERRRDDA